MTTTTTAAAATNKIRTSTATATTTTATAATTATPCGSAFGLYLVWLRFGPLSAIYVVWSSSGPLSCVAPLWASILCGSLGGFCPLRVAWAGWIDWFDKGAVWAEGGSALLLRIVYNLDCNPGRRLATGTW